MGIGQWARGVGECLIRETKTQDPNPKPRKGPPLGPDAHFADALGRISIPRCRIAQSVEQLTVNQRVLGSSPSAAAIDLNLKHVLRGAFFWFVGVV